MRRTSGNAINVSPLRREVPYPMVGRRSGVLFVITLFRKLSREICPLTGYTTACFVRNVIFDIATIARKLSLNAMHLGRRLAGTKAVAAARACSVLAGNALDCGPAARRGRHCQHACSVVGQFPDARQSSGKRPQPRVRPHLAQVSTHRANRGTRFRRCRSSQFCYSEKSRKQEEMKCNDSGSWWG